MHDQKGNVAWFGVDRCYRPKRLNRLAGLPLVARTNSRLRRKKHCLWLAGQGRVRRQVGELPFWEFSAPILWRRWVGTDFSGLFGFGPKRGGFVVQKRNETPETPETPETLETPDTLTVDVRIAFL